MVVWDEGVSARGYLGVMDKKMEATIKVSIGVLGYIFGIHDK